MQKMSSEQQLRIIDNENAMQLMPEIEWAARVMVSSILSPKDMTKRELNYSINIPWIPASVRSILVDEIKREMDQVYGYAESLYTIFKDALFTKGAHPRLVLPEAAVDRIINSGEVLTLESMNRHMAPMFSDKEGTRLNGRGYFGDLENEGRREVTMESLRKFHTSNATPADRGFVFKAYSTNEGYKENTGDLIDVVLSGITLTDNYDAIKLPMYREAMAEAKRAELSGRPEMDVGLGFGVEAPAAQQTNEAFVDPKMRAKNSGLDQKEFRNAVYKAAPNNMVTHLRVPGRSELSRRSVGRPLVTSFPSEAVIPIHVPGDVRRKIGFILLYDDAGHPITLAGADQLMKRAQTEFNAINSTNATGKDSMGSMIISKAARNLTGGTRVTQFRDLSKIFEQLVEDNLIPRLMNGAYPGGAALADAGDLYTLMLARTLCSMRTRMVFIPAEMMTYFAFDYHDNGMGKSLLDANKMLIAFRAGLLVTRMNGEMRNSIPLTKVRLKIDEDDVDFEKTWEEATHAISLTRQPQYPLSTLAINDIMDWTQRAGYLFTFEGHPRMPDTSFEFEKLSHQNPLPDPEFYDSLGKQLYLGFGIPPEIMNMMDRDEFATAIASRHIMFTQTILEFQKIASGLMTDDHHRLILSDGTMLNTIVGLVRENWGAISANLPEEDQRLFRENPRRFSLQLVERIVTAISVTLPSPDTTTLANQRQDFDDFASFVEEGMKYVAGEGVVSADMAPELAQKIPSMAPMAKAAIMRDYMARHGILPELLKISAVDDEGRAAFDLLKLTEDHVKGLAVNLMSTAKSLVPMDQAAVQDTEKLNLGSEGGDISMSTGGGGGGGGFGGDDLGIGGLDMDFSLPEEDTGGEPPADEVPPTEETPPA